MLTDKAIKKYSDGTRYSFNDIKVLVKEVGRLKGVDITKEELDAIITYSIKYSISTLEAAEMLAKLKLGFEECESKGLVITDEIFFNKGLCDVLRDVSMNSTLNIGDAHDIILISGDWDRDIPIIKTLANAGYKPKELKNIIKALNQNIKIRS